MCSVGEVTRGCRLGSKPCCLCWCCCCSCSWAKCLAAKNGSDNGPTKKPRDTSPCDPLVCGEATTTLEEIQGWGKSFDKLMRSSAGRKLFRDFLRCEYSEENIMFWLACEELKRESNPSAVEEKARFIYEDYISILSPKEVSLDSRVREIVNRNMVEPTPHTFDEAQLQIYTLMHRDSYPRFVNSPLYKTLAQISAGSPAASAAPSLDRSAPDLPTPTATVESAAPPAVNQTAPHADKQTAPHADKQTAPHADKQTAPHADKQTAPHADKQTAPHADKQTAPHADKQTAPHADKQTAPHADKQTAPHADKQTAPPAEQTAPHTENQTAGIERQTAQPDKPTGPQAVKSTTAQ